MMLNTDICLAYDVGRRSLRFDTVAGKLQRCCLWTADSFKDFFVGENGNLTCGCVGGGPLQKGQCIFETCCESMGPGPACNGHDIFGRPNRNGGNRIMKPDHPR